MLRRPLLFLAAGIVSAIIIEYYMNKTFAFFVGILLLVCLAFLHSLEWHKRKRIIICLVLISYFFGAFAYVYQSHQLGSQEKQLLGKADEAENSSIKGRVLTVENRRSESGDMCLNIRVNTSEGNVLVKYYYENDNEYPAGNNSKSYRERRRVIPGDIIEVQGEASIPQGRRNPGCFNYRLYLKSLNIPVVMNAKEINLLSVSNNTISGHLYLVKEDYIYHLYRSTDDKTAALMQAIMFGDKGELDEETLEVFQKNGTAHILAVSGLHIGIIYGFILKLWITVGNITKGIVCGKRGFAFLIFNCVFFGCYMIMANFSPSVVRAVIMILLHVFVQLTNRRYDLSNAAILVLILTLAYNPFMLFNAGFQMSFLAVLTLIMVMPFIKHIYTGVFLSSLAIQIGLGPFIIYNFNYLSLLAVVINVPVIFIAGLIVPAGLSCMVLNQSPVFETGADIIKYLCDILQWLNNTVEISGVTSFQIASPPIWIIAFYYLFLLMFITEEGRLALIHAAKAGSQGMEKFRDRTKYAARLCVMLMIISFAFAHIAGDNFNKCNLTFVDVGQGDCVCIKTNGTYLIDGGGNPNYNLGKKILKEYLLKNGTNHVDAAFVTHLHTDHYKGICELCREGMIKKYMFMKETDQ